MRAIKDQPRLITLDSSGQYRGSLLLDSPIIHPLEALMGFFRG